MANGIHRAGKSRIPSKQLGHASVNTTENFYSHIIEENKARASDCIADVLLRKKAKKARPAAPDGVPRKRFLDALAQNWPKTAIPVISNNAQKLEKPRYSS